MIIKRIAVGLLATNCYVISNKAKAFIIDPGGDAAVIKEYIKQNKLSVEFIINTHNHADHIMADSELGYPVYIHELDAPALQDTKKNQSRFLLGEVHSCEPEKLLRDNDSIHFDDITIKVLHTPGHTPGGICLQIDTVVFTGDTLFKDGVGRTDLPGGSQRDLLTSITSKLLCLDDTVRIYPGHGEESTIGRERGYF